MTNKSICLFLCLLLAGAKTIAQNVSGVSDSSVITVKDTTSKPHRPGVNKIGITAGSQGFGLDYARRITKLIAVRIGASYLPFSITTDGTKLGDVNTDTHIKARDFLNAHLVVDLYPFDGAPLRLSPGIGYFFQAKGVATISPVGNYKWNDITLTPDQIGSSTGTIKWEGVAPFASIGYDFKATRKFPVQISLEAGAYYLPKPEGTLTGDKLLADNAANEPQFRENIKNYRWLPLLQVSFSWPF